MLQWLGREKHVEGLPGIPARDLSDEEVTLYGGEKALLATGLYAKFEEIIFRENVDTEGIKRDLAKHTHERLSPKVVKAE